MTIEAEVYLMIDENGNYVVRKDEGELDEAYDDEVGGGSDLGRRIIKVVLTVPVPRTLIVKGTVPDTEEEGVEMQIE